MTSTESIEKSAPSELIGCENADLVSRFEDLQAKARTFAERSKSPRTRLAYAHSWRDYVAWCRSHRLPPTPSSPQTIVLYISDLATRERDATGRVLAWASIQRTLAAVGYHLRLARGDDARDEPLPTRHALVREVAQGIRRSLGVASHGVPALTLVDLRAASVALPDTLTGRRDRAILLVGFGGAFRRSEIAAMRVEDIAWTDGGMTIHVARSKTDQEARGRDVAILAGEHAETCPVRAVRAWLDAAKIDCGPLFRAVRGNAISRRRIDREGRMVARVLQRSLARAQLPLRVNSQGRAFAAHSLRAGFVTEAAKAGEPEWAIRKITGHESNETLQRYIRGVDLLRKHPARKIGM